MHGRARLTCTRLEGRAVPAAVAVADLNGDGRADAVVAEPDADRVAVYIAAPTGWLGPPGYYPTGPGSRPTDVMIADADDDGRNDIAAFNTGSGPGVKAFNLLLNVGNQAGFTGFVEVGRGFLVASPGPSFGRGDFDGDGLTDEVLPGGAIIWGNGTGPVRPVPPGSDAGELLNAFTTRPAEGGALVLDGSDVVFDQVGTAVGRAVSFTPSGTRFVLREAGTYRVDYTVNAGNNSGFGQPTATMAVTQNGVQVGPAFRPDTGADPDGRADRGGRGRNHPPAVVRGGHRLGGAAAGRHHHRPARRLTGGRVAGRGRDLTRPTDRRRAVLGSRYPDLWS